MTIRSCLYGAFLLLIAYTQPLAQSSGDSTALCLCHTDDLSPSGIMISHVHPKGSWMVSYRYMHMAMKGNRNGHTEVSNNEVFNTYLMAPSTMWMGMHMVMGMYGVSDRFSLMGMLNYHVNQMEMTMLDGSTHMHNGTSISGPEHMRMQSHGVGDSKLHGLYSIWESGAHSIIASLGVSLPSGRIDLKGDDQSMYPDLRLPYMMQLGSGSWDVLPGITYRFELGSFVWNTQVTGVVRPFYNSANYRYGNELTLNTWAAYQWLPWISTSARVEGNIVGKMDGLDAQIVQGFEPAGSPQNYGGQRVNGLIGVNFHLHIPKIPDSRLSIEAGVPMYQYLNGIQMPNRYMLTLGWQVAF